MPGLPNVHWSMSSASLTRALRAAALKITSPSYRDEFAAFLLLLALLESEADGTFPKVMYWAERVKKLGTRSDKEALSIVRMAREATEKCLHDCDIDPKKSQSKVAKALRVHLERMEWKQEASESAKILLEHKNLPEAPGVRLHLKMCGGRRLDDNTHVAIDNIKGHHTVAVAINKLLKMRLGFNLTPYFHVYRPHHRQSEFTPVHKSASIRSLLIDPGDTSLDLYVVGRGTEFILGIVEPPADCTGAQRIPDYGIVLELHRGVDLDGEVSKEVRGPCQYLIGQSVLGHLGVWEGPPSPIGIQPYAANLRIIPGLTALLQPPPQQRRPTDPDEQWQPLDDDERRQLAIQQRPNSFAKEGVIKNVLPDPKTTKCRCVIS